MEKVIDTIVNIGVDTYAQRFTVCFRDILGNTFTQDGLFAFERDEEGRKTGIMEIIADPSEQGNEDLRDMLLRSEEVTHALKEGIWDILYGVEYDIMHPFDGMAVERLTKTVKTRV